MALPPWPLLPAYHIVKLNEPRIASASLPAIVDCGPKPVTSAASCSSMDYALPRQSAPFVHGTVCLI